MTHSVLDKFRDFAFQRGGLWFFKPSDAIKVISSLEGLGLSILGLDAFVITSEVTQPVMECSSDFSDMKNDSWSAAKDFLEKHMKSNLMFEIIFDEQ